MILSALQLSFPKSLCITFYIFPYIIPQQPTTIVLSWLQQLSDNRQLVKHFNQPEVKVDCNHFYIAYTENIVLFVIVPMALTALVNNSTWICFNPCVNVS